MSRKRLLQQAFGLMGILLLLAGCSLTSTKLYVGPNDLIKVPPEGSMQSFIFSSNPSQEFSTTLTGDINGDQYEFSLLLATTGYTSFRASIIVDGQVVASDKFSTTKKTYERYSSKVSGIDPSTNSGDELKLVIEWLSGDKGGIASSGTTPSYIVIPKQQ